MTTEKLKPLDTNDLRRLAESIIDGEDMGIREKIDLSKAVLQYLPLIEAIEQEAKQECEWLEEVVNALNKAIQALEKELEGDKN